MGARVVVLDRSLDRLRYLDDIFMGRIETVWSSAAALEEQVLDADLIIGAVLIPGAAAPKLVNRALVSKLQKGSVMVDVAIDQGGCFETSRATSYQDPTYEVDGVVHYCVANMPGGVARTATLALTNATLPYVVRLANQGLDALRDDARFALGLNVHEGKLTHAGVGEAFNLDAVSPTEALTS
jgi:alanine dehydrogenase